MGTSCGASLQLRAKTFYVFVEAEVVMLILAGAITRITQITSPSKLYRMFYRVSRLSFSLSRSPIGCGVVVLMSEAEGLPWRWVPRWHFKRTAHGKNEADHQGLLRIRQVK